MSLWKKVPSGRNPPEIINVIIETPKGSKNKYEVSKEFDCILLDRVLHSSVVFPLAYGLIPRTFYEDGDPLDALVLISEPTFPGCVVEARPIGVLEMSDEKGQDDKILTVACGDPKNSQYLELEDIPQHYLDEISEFFKTYKKLEENKGTNVIGWQGRVRATEIVTDSLALFRNKFGYK
ncbi:MAG TPA: inorganic diphosphatase [Methanomassiliicoccales archaeon]|jgi:inorganic pyrophosphatase|nr:inorganic diphosphatase [Euryarchaeota archaeon]HOE52187.1 inorganic diphosphatase [Methanomassiliicoccales archaeon]HOO04672.1 inorganic diphosphatase [Methanomassiliicoccales archaeon]HPD09079.1 inorganic diphosphatase [Methanomassiliicoccales archaeon]HQM66292.1 inorganic diphosphatase [Methanomassiliicoccales archaeon]